MNLCGGTLCAVFKTTCIVCMDAVHCEFDISSEAGKAGRACKGSLEAHTKLADLAECTIHNPALFLQLPSSSLGRLQVFSSALGPTEGQGRVKVKGTWGLQHVGYINSTEAQGGDEAFEPVEFVPLASLVKSDVWILKVDTVGGR